MHTQNDATLKAARPSPAILLRRKALVQVAQERGWLHDFDWFARNFGRLHYIRPAFACEYDFSYQASFPHAIVASCLEWGDPPAIQQRIVNVSHAFVDVFRTDRGEDVARAVFELAEAHAGLLSDALVAREPGKPPRLVGRRV